MTYAIDAVPVRVVIVDDEPLAREGLRMRLEHADGVAVVGECGDGDTAVELILRLRPDVAFLDFQMPGRTGIDVVRTVGPERCPYYVFVTAFEAPAIGAFEVNALDYLVKPIATDRLMAALDRARRAVRQRNQAARSEKLEDVLAEVQAAAAPGAAARAAKLSVRVGNRIILVAPADIDWIEAAGDYTQLHVGPKTWLSSDSMTALDGKLAPLGFVRIHRSFIVNVERVAELRTLDDGEYTVVLRDGATLKLSRSYRGSLPALLRTEC